METAHTLDETLSGLGGCASWNELVVHHTRGELSAAVASGELIRVSRGRYVSPAVADHRRAAHAHSATLSHLSAALHHGWKVAATPPLPTMTIPRMRKRRVPTTIGVVAWADLPETDVSEGVTTPLRTVLDCARTLPLGEGLAVADSALRDDAITPAELRTAAAELRGPGSAAARRVAMLADGRAANPLESTLRAILADVPELDLVPQCVIADDGCFAVADLADRRLRLVVEAEGFAYHGSRADWRSDARRFTDLTAHGWWVLRFTYEDVMHHPDRVRRLVRTWLVTTGFAAVATA